MQTATQHTGTVGKRQEMTVKFHKALSFDGFCGTRVLVLMECNGHSVVWWTTWSSFPGEMEQGGVYKVKATVKDHAEYKGKPQTVVNRLQLVECVKLPPERELEMECGKYGQMLFDAKVIKSYFDLPEFRGDLQAELNYLKAECAKHGLK